MTAVSIGALPLSAETPRLAASFWAPPPPNRLQELAERGLDIAELRLDKAAAGGRRRLPEAFAGFPTIATVRAATEGGEWHGEEDARCQTLLQALAHTDAVDVELAAAFMPEVVAAARTRGKTVILSRHDFAAAATAAKLDDTAAAVAAAGGDIVKCAFLCLTAADFQILSDFTARCRRSGHVCIVIGLDDGSGNRYAEQARRELPRCGACLAFAAVGEASAPGQLSLEEMRAALLAGAASPRR